MEAELTEAKLDWDYLHTVSKETAAMAEAHLLSGDEQAAKDCYRVAAILEYNALNRLPWDGSRKRTIGITLVRALSLYEKAGLQHKADGLRQEWANKTHLLPGFAVKQVQQPSPAQP